MSYFTLLYATLIWRIKEGALPATSAMPKWQTAVAHLTHGLLLLATLAMPLSGFIMSYAAVVQLASLSLSY
ncbi:hypothetical protein NCCP2140_35440 [Pseudoalteromonas sp. NCCP-2140]|nr:hypothetical protein NCCP2140_35440 [Pseudoalteromonas sp. NCCP-2140]